MISSKSPDINSRADSPEYVNTELLWNPAPDKSNSSIKVITTPESKEKTPPVAITAEVTSIVKKHIASMIDQKQSRSPGRNDGFHANECASSRAKVQNRRVRNDPEYLHALENAKY